MAGQGDLQGLYYSVATGYKAFMFDTDLRRSRSVLKLGSFVSRTKELSKGGAYTLVEVGWSSGDVLR